MSRRLLNISREEDFTTSLGNLFHLDHSGRIAISSPVLPTLLWVAANVWSGNKADQRTNNLPILMQQHDMLWLAQERMAQGHVLVTGVEKNHFVFLV